MCQGCSCLNELNVIQTINLEKLVYISASVLRGPSSGKPKFHSGLYLWHCCKGLFHPRVLPIWSLPQVIRIDVTQPQIVRPDKHTRMQLNPGGPDGVHALSVPVPYCAVKAWRVFRPLATRYRPRKRYHMSLNPVPLGLSRLPQLLEPAQLIDLVELDDLDKISPPAGQRVQFLVAPALGHGWIRQHAGCKLPEDDDDGLGVAHVS